MEKERAREPKRTIATTARILITRTKDQQKALASVHLNHSNNKRHHSLSVCGDRGGGDDDLTLMVGLKKDKIKCSRGSSSGCEDGEMGNGGCHDCDDDVIRSPPTMAISTTSTNSKKRVKLNGKIGDHYGSVVPRRLRSALSRRSSESASPPVPSVKRIWNPSSNGINGVKRSTESMISGPLTKDEEEVIEALSSLASVVTDTKPLSSEMERRSSDRNGDVKSTTSKVLSENPKAEDMQSPFMPAGVNFVATPPDIKESSEVGRVKPFIGMASLEQPISMVKSGIQNIDLGLKRAAGADDKGPSLFGKTDYPLKLNGIVNSSHQTGTLLHVLPSNGKFQIAQLEATARPKPEVGALTQMHTYEPMRQEMESLKEQDGIFNAACEDETASDIWNPMPTTSACGDLTGSISTKAAVGPDSTRFAARPGPTGNNRFPEKALFNLTAEGGSWKKCATHVYVSHLIHNHEDTGKKHQWPLRWNHCKLNNGKELSTSADRMASVPKNDLSSTSCTGVYGGTTDSKHCKSRVGTHHDRRMVQPDQKHPTASGINSRTKSTCNFLSLSTCGESNTSGKNRESHGEVPVPYIQSLPPHHRMVPFSLPPGHYPSPYTEQIAAQQIPHYICHPSYGLHMGHVGGPTAHQQHMWQAHLAQYRPPTVTTKFQNSRPQDPPATIPSAPPSSSSVGNRVGHHAANPPQQLIPISLTATTTTTNTKKHNQQAYYNHLSSYDGSKLRPEGSSQLQLPCNLQHT